MLVVIVVNLFSFLFTDFIFDEPLPRHSGQILLIYKSYKDYETCFWAVRTKLTHKTESPNTTQASESWCFRTV